jgi:membrane associated rhomboid family serine protease
VTYTEDQYAPPEKKRLLLSMLIPFFLIALMWLVRAVEVLFDTDLYFLGIFPLKASSLTGIITSPFIHADVQHLFNNTLPLFVLGTALFYFYSQVAFRVLLWLFLFTGLAVWLTGRPAWHIGASGIVYGLASFLFVSGIIRRHIPLMGLSLLVAFLYGQLVWGIFPGFRVNISWESHMLGAAVGLFLAAWYRAEGPQRPVPFYENEEEDEGPGAEENGEGSDNQIN